MNIKEALDLAPPTPACFPDRPQWVDYLLHCQEFGKREAQRPFKDGIYRPAFNFCAECTPQHAYAMTAKGHCRPGQFRVVPIVAAPAAEVACS